MKKRHINMNLKGILLTVSIIVAIILIVVSITSFGKGGNNEDEVIIKDNVNVITAETDREFQPINVTNDTISFRNDPKYEVGDVIVAGIIESVPNGFIRRITGVTETSGIYEYKTEHAILTDVFEKAHIIKTFAVTENEVKDMDEIDNGVMTLNLSSAQDDAIIKSLLYSGNEEINIEKTSNVKIKPSENGLGVAVELNDEIGENLQVDGEVEVNTYFELKIDVEDEEIDFGMAIHTDTKGELFVGYREDLFDKDKKDNFSGKYEKEIISKALPNIQFFIGPVPVVITNDFELSAEISTQLEGQIGTTIGVNAERVSGFVYGSKLGDIVEIDEKKYLSDGMEWQTEAKAAGELEAGIYAHLITKLYGSTGADLSVGITGEVEGELALSVDEQSTPMLYGNLALSVGPKASGKIVVTTPIIDHNLVEAEILKTTFPAFWEKDWEVLNPTYYSDIVTNVGDDRGTKGNAEPTRELQISEENLLIGEPNKHGNSIGNLNEDGLIARQGDWIYFNDSEVKLFRKETVDGVNGKILAECNPYYINVVGEWIYYCEWSDRSLCKMKVDGSEMQTLTEDYVDYVYVEDEWIYYKSSENKVPVLCRMHLDGSGKEKIFEESGDIHFINCVYQGRVYYEKETVNSEYQLCSVSIDGNDNIVLVDGRISYLNVDDGWLYYRGDDEGHCLYKMKTDGTKKVCLTNASAANIIVWDEWIYFIAYDEDDALETDMIYRIKKDGTNLQCAKNIHKVRAYSVVEGMIRQIHSNNHREYFYSFEEACFLDVEMEENKISELTTKEFKAVPISYLFIIDGEEPEGAWVYKLLIENRKLKVHGSLDVIIEGAAVECMSDDVWTFKLAENVVLDGFESYGDIEKQIKKFNEEGGLYALKAKEFFFRVENDEVTYIRLVE